MARGVLKVLRGGFEGREANSEVLWENSLVEPDEAVRLVVRLVLQAAQLPSKKKHTLFVDITPVLVRVKLALARALRSPGPYLEIMISWRISPKVFCSSPFTFTLPSTGMI